jgi:hypothetical protein
MDYLIEDEYQEYILDIMLSVANQYPIALSNYLCLFDNSISYESHKVDRIISTIGKSLKVTY